MSRSLRALRAHPHPHVDPLRQHRPPGPLLMMLEARAPWEWASMLAAMPWLARLPVGDGHPVLVFPGLGANDLSTVPLRGFLAGRGYTAYGWEQGFNFGPGNRHALAHSLHRAGEIARRHGERVSLIGWSLGGIYAREIAKEIPERVRCVITLGTPFAGHPRATNAWRFFELVSGQSAHDEEMLEQIRRPPPVPTTSLYSRTDGVVAWHCSLNEASPLAENIEVHASHIGMGMNPLALYAIADRLVQDPDHWRPFDLRGARRWFYKMTHHAPLAAAQGS